MVEISWTILAGTVSFLVGMGSVLLANLLSERNALKDMERLLMTQHNEAEAKLEYAVRQWVHYENHCERQWVHYENHCDARVRNGQRSPWTTEDMHERMDKALAATEENKEADNE